MFELLVFISFVDCFVTYCLNDEKRKIMENVEHDAIEQYYVEQKDLLSKYYKNCDKEIKEYYDRCAVFKKEYYDAKIEDREIIANKCKEFIRSNEKKEIQEYALEMKNISVSIVRDSMINYAIRVDNERFLDYICESSMIESAFDIKELNNLKSYTISEAHSQTKPV